MLATGLAAAGLAAVLFGSAFVATEVALRSFEPLSVVFWRAAVASVALTPIVLLRTGRAPTVAGSADVTAVRRGLRLATLGLAGGPIFLAGMAIAVDHLGAAVTAFVVGLYAILAAILARPILGERVGSALGGLVVALVGIAFLAENGGALDGVGVASGLVAATSYSLYIVLGRRWSVPYRLRPELIAGAGVALTAAAMLSWLVATDPAALRPVVVPPDAVVAILWLGFVLVAGQTLLMSSVRRVNARRSAGLLLLNPLTASILASIVLHSRPGPAQVLGGVLVLAGMALAVRRGPGAIALA